MADHKGQFELSQKDVKGEASSPSPAFNEAYPLAGSRGPIPTEQVWPFTCGTDSHPDKQAQHSNHRVFKIGASKVEVIDNKKATLTYGDGSKTALEFDGNKLTKITEANGNAWIRTGSGDRGTGEEWVSNTKEHWKGHILVDQGAIYWIGNDDYIKEVHHDGSQSVTTLSLSVFKFKDQYLQSLSRLDKNNDNVLDKIELMAALQDKSLPSRDAQMVAALFENFDALSGISDDHERNSGISTLDILKFNQRSKLCTDQCAQFVDLKKFALSGFNKTSDKDYCLTVNEIDKLLKNMPVNCDLGEKNGLELLRLNFDQIKGKDGISIKDLNSYLAQMQESIKKQTQIEDGVEESLNLTRKELEHSQGKLSLEQIYDTRIKLKEELSRTYNISFSGDGERVSYQADMKHSPTGEMTPEFSPMLLVRSPRLFELDAIGSGVAHGQPSHFINDTRQGIKFNFLRYKAAGLENAGAFHSIDKNGQSAIFINPENNNLLATIKEARQAHRGVREAIEYTVMHESTHNTQYRLGWRHFNNFERNIGPKLGWQLFEQGDNQVWAIKGKDGKFYQNINSCWWKWNSANDLNESLKDHSKASMPPLRPLSTLVKWEEVAKQAPIKPVTWYFDQPIEMHAEALTFFRLGNEYRGKLLDETPALYNIVKASDQDEINLAYPPGKDGKARLIRGTHGFLVPNTIDNQKVVADFESKHLKIARR